MIANCLPTGTALWRLVGRGAPLRCTHTKIQRVRKSRPRRQEGTSGCIASGGFPEADFRHAFHLADIIRRRPLVILQPVTRSTLWSRRRSRSRNRSTGCVRICQDDHYRKKICQGAIHPPVPGGVASVPYYGGFPEAYLFLYSHAAMRFREKKGVCISMYCGTFVQLANGIAANNQRKSSEWGWYVLSRRPFSGSIPRSRLFLDVRFSLLEEGACVGCASYGTPGVGYIVCPIQQ